MSVDNYLVFYISDKDARIVTVIRIIYAGRDVDSQLETHTSNNRSKIINSVKAYEMQ